MKGFPDLPPLWWAASIACIYFAKWTRPSWHFEADLLTLVSRVVFYTALAMVAWSAIWFWRKKTPIEPHHTPKTLIVEGPYRVSRNPIYLALVLLTFASALGHGSIFGIICTVILWIILDRRFAAKEEALLIEVFEEEAEAYLAKTRRWI
ncbi:MAG: isoprenylcysteine carboxylmethyltransferase family protein [Ascidiaceihabitans sp.]|nr:isoprenylcysteine carboxylmethyltransferase family protein [Ascidiaceihabitans sp.]